MGEIAWGLLAAGILLGVVNAAGLGMAVRGVRAGHGTGASVTALVCAAGALVGFGIVVYSLNFSGNLGR